MADKGIVRLTVTKYGYQTGCGSGFGDLAPSGKCVGSEWSAPIEVVRLEGSEEPETFVIDGQGRIVYKHIGPIQASDIEKKILPAVEQARAGG